MSRHLCSKLVLAVLFAALAVPPPHKLRLRQRRDWCDNGRWSRRFDYKMDSAQAMSGRNIVVRRKSQRGPPLLRGLGVEFEARDLSVHRSPRFPTIFAPIPWAVDLPTLTGISTISGHT